MISQLKQRQVFKVATIYAVSAWPLIQIADLAVPALGLPDSAMTLLLQIFVAGFPLCLIFAWLFNFTPNGIVRARKDAPVQNEPKANMQATLAVVGALLLVFLATLGTQLMMEEQASEQINTPSAIAPVQAPVAQTPAAAKKESIAILPFVPFSDDPADEFFADGMVEELLNLLAKIPDLKVAARTSSFAYKGVSNKTIAEIGQELGVDTILEGSIRKNDVTNKIRVTAQLIKVSTGEHIWSETYDREYRDIFQIQDDIARAVVGKMKKTLLGAPKESMFIAETSNVDAMVAYGKGQQQMQHRTATSLQKALMHFNQAVALDGQYARAYVGIADANILLALYGNLSKVVAHENAQKAIDTALTINNNLGAAYASKGLLLSSKNPLEAEAAFKQAISLNPNYAMTYMWYGSLLQNSGKQQDAHKLNIQALELDPKSPIAAFNVAWGYYLNGREDKAMELFSQIIANDPYYPGAYNLVGNILSSRGRLDQAGSMYERALDVDPKNVSAINGLLTTSMDLRDAKGVHKWFKYVEEHPGAFSDTDINLMKARFYISQGDKQGAFEFLQKVDYSDMPNGFQYFLEGEMAYYSGNYAQAITHYEKLRTTYGDNIGAFFYMNDGQVAAHLAFAYAQQQQQNISVQLTNEFKDFIEKEMKTASNNPAYYYNMALVKALRNNTQEAYFYMQGAIDAGWVRTWQAEFEPIFSSIINTEQFEQMLGGVSARIATMKSKMQNEIDDEFLLADGDGF